MYIWIQYQDRDALPSASYIFGLTKKVTTTPTNLREDNRSRSKHSDRVGRTSAIAGSFPIEGGSIPERTVHLGRYI